MAFMNTRPKPSRGMYETVNTQCLKKFSQGMNS